MASLPQGITERYAYDQAGHLIGEYGAGTVKGKGHGNGNGNGNGKGKGKGNGHDKKPNPHQRGKSSTVNRDYIWPDNLPVAVIDDTTSGSVTTSVVDYITADGLGTPRVAGWPASPRNQVQSRLAPM